MAEDSVRDTGSDRGTAPDDGLTAAQRVVWKRLGETTRPLGEVVGAFVGEFGGVARDHPESAATLLEAVAPLPTPVEPEPVEPEPRLPLFDLALRRYEPAAPIVDPLGSVELLRATFEDETERAEWQRFVGDLQQAIAPRHIVWAVKSVPAGTLRRELYFLGRGDPLTDMFDAVRGVIGGRAEWRAPTVLPVRSIDFSIEPHFDAGHLAPIESIDVRTVMAGEPSDGVIAYIGTDDRLVLKNVYGMYAYPSELRAIRTRPGARRENVPERCAALSTSRATRRCCVGEGHAVDGSRRSGCSIAVLERCRAEVNVTHQRDDDGHRPGHLFGLRARPSGSFPHIEWLQDTMLGESNGVVREAPSPHL